MKKRIGTILVISILLTNCSVSTENFPEPEKLKMAIANSISVPFTTNDTLVYISTVGICGNSSQDEINRMYSPCLNDRPYVGILRQRFSGRFLVTGDSLGKIMADRFEVAKLDSGTAWSYFNRDKILVSITGTALTNNSVSIVEMYSYKGQQKFLGKIFSYDNDKWTFKTMKAE